MKLEFQYILKVLLIMFNAVLVDLIINYFCPEYNITYDNALMYCILCEVARCAVNLKNMKKDDDND